jgi:ATPase family associated with various cellular activities (AAA)
MATHDPWNIAAPVQTNVVVAEGLRGPQPRWWRTAGEMSGLPGNDAAPGKPWWNESTIPAFGEHSGTDVHSWLGVAMFKQAIEGGPPLHMGNFEGNLTVPPKRFMETLVETMQLRPVKYSYGRQGINRILFSSKDSMLALGFQEGGRYADVSLASVNEGIFKNVAKLCAGILTHDNPKEGFVYALAKGMMGYNLTRIGAAGTPLERGNYSPKVLANYDHVVSDLKAESPCGRLILMAGEPGTGKTYLVRSLLADIPKAAFVVVPPHMVKELGSPELLPALASARHDGLSGPMALIIEDADKVLVNRDAGDMAAISSLLNLGDGILGSVLDVRIIATTNAAKLDMDAATRRAGRLCSYIDVGTIEPEQAETIVQRLLPTATVRPPKRVTLAEVYSHARSMGWTPPPKVPPANPWEKSYIL